jgi:hypothetical protein
MSWNPFKKMELPAKPESKDDPFASSSDEDPFATEDSDPFESSRPGSDTKNDDPFENEYEGSFPDSNPEEKPPQPTGRPAGLPPPDPTPKLPPGVVSKKDLKAILNSEVKTYPVCALAGGVNFLKGAQLGAGMGLLFGAYEGANAGLWREPTRFLGFIGGKSIGNALSFGSFLGVYSGMKCSCEVSRGGTKDVYNAGVAGAVAGSLSSLRTRNPMLIAPSAAFGGVLMMVIEGIQGPAP